MKWIGQHIWDFITRFRSDVYMEAVESGTIASGGNLGLDANNKIVKADTEAGELTIANATDDRIVTSTGGTGLNAESTLTYSGTTHMLELDGGGVPGLYLGHTGANANDAHIEFYNQRGGAVGIDSDDCGTFMFYGNNNAGTPEKIAYGSIRTSIQERDDGDEAGIMRLQVATSDDSTSGVQQALTATGHATANTVDIGLGYGATSTTTIAGDLDIDGDTITSAGVLKIIPADVSGLALHIDADADTDNEVQIDAGVLDINVTATATVDVATSLTITGKTLMNNRTLTVTAGSSAGEFDGDVVYTGTTTGMTAGDLYVYNNSGLWQLANAGAEGTTKGLLAIALGAESDTHGMLLRGMVTSGAIAGSPDEGAELYIRASNGDITTAAPTGSGQFVRVIGYCMENSNNRIYFNPDNTYIEIA
tara:strand:- start:94 stop:1356 length:1263 start_codon:yes stop_codon:yes gene_type:complete